MLLMLRVCFCLHYVICGQNNSSYVIRINWWKLENMITRLHVISGVIFQQVKRFFDEGSSDFRVCLLLFCLMSACTIVFFLARTSSYIQIFILWRLCEIMLSTVLLLFVCVYQCLPSVFVFFFFKIKRWGWQS